MTIITAIVEKHKTESKLGITFSRLNSDSPLVIEKIHDDGLFVSTDLKAGMIVQSIMGIPMMFETAKLAVDTLRSANAGEQVEVNVRVNIGEVIKTDMEQK